MKTFILPVTWLTDFKKMIRYPYDDLDSNLSTYLNISLTNIATQYMGLKEDEPSIKVWFPIITAEDRVKVAVFHLAATFYENPDIMLTNSGGTLVDKNQIFRILGGLTTYYTVDKLKKAIVPETPITPETSDIWDAINKNIANIKINAGEIELLTVALNSLKNIADTNTQSIIKSDLVIAANTENISTNSNNIILVTKKADKNESEIGTLKTNVATNTTNIKTNTDNLTASKSKIDTNTNNIAINKTDLDNTKTSVANMSVAVAKNVTDIETSKNNIAANLVKINKNVTDINTANTNITSNTNNIAANLVKIEANKTNIASNTNAITLANTNIANNTTAINAANTKIETNKTNTAANLAKINTNITNIMLNTASIGDATTKITQLQTTTANLIAKVDRTYAYNVEYATGETLGNKPIYAMLVQKGDVKSDTDIPASGDLVNGVDTFLGVEYGVISRKQVLQLHNINSVNNSPDQHASFIYQTGNKIAYWFFQTMQLSTFKNRPFIALIKYTKA